MATSMIPLEAPPGKGAGHSGTRRALFHYDVSVPGRPKGLLFDLDNTLLDRDGAFRGWIKRLPIEAKDRARAVTLDGGGTTAPGAVCEFLASLLSRSAADVWTQMKAGIASEIVVNFAVRNLMQELSQAMPTAVVTNGGGDNQRRKLRAAKLDDIFGDRVIISAEVGAAKPSAAIFLRGLAAIDCDPRDAMFVGDDWTTDVGGALAAGIRPVWISHGRGRPVAPPTLPILTIESVLELPEVLER